MFENLDQVADLSLREARNNQSNNTLITYDCNNEGLCAKLRRISQYIFDFM